MDGSIRSHHLSQACMIKIIRVHFLLTSCVTMLTQCLFFVDVIMDMLGSPKIRQIITENYQNSEDPKLIRQAIMRARYVNHLGTVLIVRVKSN